MKKHSLNIEWKNSKIMIKIRNIFFKNVFILICVQIVLFFLLISFENINKNNIHTVSLIINIFLIIGLLPIFQPLYSKKNNENFKDQYIRNNVIIEKLIKILFFLLKFNIISFFVIVSLYGYIILGSYFDQSFQMITYGKYVKISIFVIIVECLFLMLKALHTIEYVRLYLKTIENIVFKVT